MFAKPPPATLALIVVTVVVYFLQMSGGESFVERFALWPVNTPLFEPWQAITYAFLHDTQTLAHIFFNMFALFMFAPQLELLWGSRRFLLYYFVSVLAAALAQIAVTSMTGSLYPTLGASGGVFGVLLAFALFFPQQRIAIYGVIPMPAWLFVALYAVLELVLGVTNTQAGVAHFAHLGGMLGGALLIFFWRAQGSTRRRF
jgi:membrane associated rhomboid family serine protease